ncbi:MAG: alpha/beta fold hydrolase, partial [Acidobacteria bacterium]|nr:alpha/beta fold hydrolase [Acidobacteriota bacterium]
TNGHWMTLYAWGNPRYFPRLPPSTQRLFEVAPATRVVADCHWQARAWERPTLLALHGLNGSSDAHYMRGLAAKAFERGMNVVRLNQRNCGDTEHLAEGLFHSGLTADAAHVMHELTRVDGLSAIAVAGYSLGGNLALKLAGEYGAFPPSVRAVRPVPRSDDRPPAVHRSPRVRARRALRLRRPEVRRRRRLLGRESDRGIRRETGQIVARGFEREDVGRVLSDPLAGVRRPATVCY